MQDTWKASRRLTVDYGVRFLWYTPWYSTQPAAVFVPERYDPAKAPRLYQPARDQQRQRRARSGHRTDAPERLRRQRSCRAPAIATTAWSATAIRTTRRASATTRASSRSRALGLAWDLRGDGKTALHASVGLYHNPHVNANGMDAMARNPPAQNTPSIIYGTMDTLLAAGAQGAFSNRPSDVFGVERDAKTPKSYNYSVGVQREIGWGTVLDVTYAGFQMRNGEMSTNINTVPETARFLDVHPENANPQNPTTAKPNEFLRPYSGYQDITIRSALRHARLQLAAGAAQPPLHQRPAVRRRLHLRQDRGRRHRAATRPRTTRSGPGTAWNYGADHARRSSTTSSSTTRGTCPTAAGMWDNASRADSLDGWQLSGDTASSAATGRARRRRRPTTSTSPAVTAGRVRGSAAIASARAATTAIRRRAAPAATSTSPPSAG